MSRHSAQRQKPKRIRYAVVGLGYISQVAMLPAFCTRQEKLRTGRAGLGPLK
jgi:predicted dehydrogenase